MHIVTSTGVYKDAVDAYRQPLPLSKADPFTIKFIKKLLDAEKLDLVILTED